MWFTLVVIFEALFGCHDIPILGKSPIKWRQHSNMTIAVDWDVKRQFKQQTEDDQSDQMLKVAKYIGHLCLKKCHSGKGFTHHDKRGSG